MYFLVLLSAFFLPLNSIGAKLNRTKEKAKLLGISFLVGGAAATSWLVCLLVKQTVTGDMYLYAAVFAVIYIATLLIGFLAYAKGPLSVTSTFANASLVVIVLANTLLFKEELRLLSALSILGTLISLLLLSMPEKAEPKVEKERSASSVHLLWLLLCIALLLGNSAISISIKFRQIHANGSNAFAFMALCYTFSFIASLVAYAVSQCKRPTLKNDFESVRNNASAIVLQMVGNVGSNLLVTFLSSRVVASVLYPVNMGGGLVLAVVCGFIFFREKLTVRSGIGIILGILSLILLNI